MSVSSGSGLCGGLPTRFPIFPLPGAILLPSGNLPLNIFEPRYLQMTRDAMRTDRVIGMVQPCGGGTAHPELFRGRLRRPDHQLRRDRGRPLSDHPDRSLPVRPGRGAAGQHAIPAGERQLRALAGDLEPPPPSDRLRPDLLDALRSYFEVHEIRADWSQVRAAPLGGLITSLAMICPFEPCEKQALLEATDPERRCEVLTALLQMGRSAARSGPPARGIEPSTARA